MRISPIERQRLVQKLILARQLSRVSKAQIARRAGLSREAIGQMESGYLAMSENALKAYAALCGLKSDEVLLEWDKCPDDVLARLKARPELCAFIRQS